MATRKFKSHCKIIDYVESVDPELAAVIRGTCSELTLGSTKGKPGITFLMPEDKAFKKKLIDLAYSAEPDDLIKASDMINALIIRDVFKSGSEWMAHKDDIPNSLIPPQHVEIASATATEVTFANGAKASLDTNFKDASRKSNLAVWKLVSGEIPVTTEKKASLKYANAGKKGKTGGYDVTVQVAASERFKISLAVENAYVLHQLQKSTGAGSQSRDVYLETTLSLINYIANVRKDMATLYERVLPLISLDKIDFYLLVEPHKFGGNYILDDMLIREWWMQRQSHSFSCKQVIAQIEQWLSQGSGALVYTSRQQLQDKLSQVRQHLSQYIDARPRQCVDEIAKVYEQIEQSNSIDGVGPIYPSTLHAHYQSEPGLKMIQDELRYFTYGEFKKLENEPMFDQGRFHEIVNMIAECLYTATPEERARQQKLLNKNSIKYLISPTEKIGEIRVFLHSTMFAYIPMTKSEAMNLKQKHSVRRPDPQNIVIFNIAKDLYIQHSRSAVGNSASIDVINMIRDLDIETLDPALKDELRRKLGL